MEKEKRIRIFRRVMGGPVGLFLRLKLNAVWDPLPALSGGVLIVSNHNTDYDPLIIASATERSIHFVATEGIKRIPVAGWLADRFCWIILHYKGRAGISTVRAMLSALKAGNPVMVFPEGNRSFNGITGAFEPSIAKVAKKAGTPLATYRIEGGYLTSPRWGSGVRKGKMRARLVKLYSPEQLSAMSESEVRDAIAADIYEDAYAAQREKRIEYKGRRRAEGIESTLFLCPGCGAMGTMHGRGDRLECQCGFGAFYDNFGYIVSDAGEKYTVTGLDSKNHEYIRSLPAGKDSEEVLFRDTVEVHSVNNDHTAGERKTVQLLATPAGLRIGKIRLGFGEISGLAIQGRNRMQVTYEAADGPQLVEINGPASFSALKYLYLYNNYREGAVN